MSVGVLLDVDAAVGDVGVPPPHPIINPDMDRMATVLTTRICTAAHRASDVPPSDFRKCCCSIRVLAMMCAITQQIRTPLNKPVLAQRPVGLSMRDDVRRQQPHIKTVAITRGSVLPTIFREHEE